MVITRVGVLSLGKLLGVFYALLGLIVGALFAIVSLLGAANSQASDAFAGLLFGVGSVIFLPVFYGVLILFFGLIWALLYNGIAGVSGGVENEETRHLAPAIVSKRRDGH